MGTSETRHIVFVILISLQIPSIFCYIGLIYYNVSNRSILRSLHSHTPLVLLVVGLITVLVDLSMILQFLRTGINSPSTEEYCRFLNFLDSAVYTLFPIIIFWQAVEKNMLIFYHRQFFDTKRKRLLFHYFPYVFIFGYVFLYYAYAYFIPMCVSIYKYNQMLCGNLCGNIVNPGLSVYNQVVNIILATFFMVFVNIGLWVRVVWQKQRRVGRTMEWRQQRKMMLQFLPISVLYASCNVPYASLKCYQHIAGSTPLLDLIQDFYFFYLFYLICTLHPFAALLGMSDVYVKWFRRQDTSTRITPANVPMENRANQAATIPL